MEISPELKDTLEHHIESLLNYGSGGCDPGSGLRAILENDLYMTLRRLDIPTRLLLGEIVMWMIQSLPPESYGSRSKVDAWMAAKRREQFHG